MTCYFDTSGTTMDVYDHEGNLIAEDDEFGGSWTGDYPNEVRSLLIDTARENSNIGQGNAPVATDYTVSIMLDLIAEDIEQGVPS